MFVCWFCLVVCFAVGWLFCCWLVAIGFVWCVRLFVWLVGWLVLFCFVLFCFVLFCFVLLLFFLLVLLILPGDPKNTVFFWWGGGPGSDCLARLAGRRAGTALLLPPPPPHSYPSSFLGTAAAPSPPLGLDYTAAVLGLMVPGHFQIPDWFIWPV